MRSKWLMLSIPLIFMLLSCNRIAKTPQQKRIQNAMRFSEIYQQEKTIALQFTRNARVEKINDAVLLPSRQLCVLTSGAQPSAYLFNVDGALIRQLQPGSRMRLQFGLPWQVEYDATGNIHILDLKKHMIYVFDSTGTFLRSLAAPNDAASFRISPSGAYYFSLPIATDKTTVISTTNDGTALRSFAMMPPLIRDILRIKPIVTPRPLMTFDGDGAFYNAFPVENKIYKFNRENRYLGVFSAAIQNYHAPLSIEHWKNATRQPNGLSQLLSTTTLFVSLHNAAPGVILAEFNNLSDRIPRYLVFHSTKGPLLNGGIPFDKDRYGEIIRAEKERLFTSLSTKQANGFMQHHILVFILPRK